jgi:hypothetical protein
MVRSRVRGYSRARPRGAQPLAAPTLGRCRHKTNITLCLCQLPVGRPRELAGFRLLVAIRDMLGLCSRRFGLPLSLILSSGADDAPLVVMTGIKELMFWFRIRTSHCSIASKPNQAYHTPTLLFAMFQNHQPGRKFPDSHSLPRVPHLISRAKVETISPGSLQWYTISQIPSLVSVLGRVMYENSSPAWNALRLINLRLLRIFVTTHVSKYLNLDQTQAILLSNMLTTLAFQPWNCFR